MKTNTENYNMYKDATPEECISIVKEREYKTRNQLRTNDRKLYHRMEVLGCLGDCFGELEGKYSKRSKEDICNEAKTYGTSERLLKENKTLWGRLWRNGWLEDTFGEKDKPIAQYTPEECFAVIDEFYMEHPEVDKSPMVFQQNHPHGIAIMNRMWVLKCSKEYSWDNYKETKVSQVSIINAFIENIDFWDALTIPEILGIASAFGSQSLMNKMLKKLAKSGPESEERKFMLDSIKEMEEMSEDEALEEINKDEDDEVKENDMIEEIVKAAENMPSDEVEYTNELERIGKVMVGMERLQGNKDIMNIINSGNVIKTLKDSITKRILLLSFEHPQVFDELEQKYCK